MGSKLLAFNWSPEESLKVSFFTDIFIPDMGDHYLFP